MQLSSYTAAQRHYIEHSAQHEQTELGGLLLQPLPTTATTISSSNTTMSTSNNSSGSANSELTLLAQGDGFFSNGAHSKALDCYQQQLQGKTIDIYWTVFMTILSSMLVTVRGSWIECVDMVSADVVMMYDVGSAKNAGLRLWCTMQTLCYFESCSPC
jgi:hypothetical protein